MQFMIKRKLLSVSEAAEYLGLAEWTIRGWVSRRKIPVVKLGRRTLFDIDDLNQWIAEHKVSAINWEEATMTPSVTT